MRQKPPAIDWMITVMSTLNPGHEIFGRAYVRPREERPVPAALQPGYVANPNGFFSGLPIPANASKKRKVSTMFTSQVDRKAMQVEALEQRSGRLNEELAAARQELEQYRQHRQQELDAGLGRAGQQPWQKPMPMPQE